MPEITVGLLFAFGFVLLCSLPIILLVFLALMGLGIFYVESPKKASSVFGSFLGATIAIGLVVRFGMNMFQTKPPPPPPPPNDERFILDVNQCEPTCAGWEDHVACNKGCIEAARKRLEARAGVP